MRSPARFVAGCRASVVLLALAAIGGQSVPAETTAESATETSGSSGARELVGLSIDTGFGPSACVLRGRDARQQLVVTAHTRSGREVDVTGEVAFDTSPEGVVAVDATGLVAPMADGQVTVTATSGEGLKAEVALQVTHMSNDPAVNFPNQVVPVFTKLSCNSGGCHGKSGGQNGFMLSLLGFEPGEDYEHLVKEGRGRRLFPAAPDQSLLLLKATNSVPHGGGGRLEAGAPEYRLLRRWVAQGMPYGSPDDPSVARIDVFPSERTMSRAARQQLVVTAHYTDGTMEDVTQLAMFEPNSPEMADVSEAGLVRTLDLAGDVAVMIRYQGHVAVFRASIPLGVEVKALPPVRNFVDELVFKKLQTLGVPPSGVCDDATFIRRVTIDVAGRLPTSEEAEAFLGDSDPDKRDKLVDRLLDSGDYADFFANKWSAILRNRRARPTYVRGTYGLHDWIRHSLYENKPYDQFVRELLAASGEIGEHPPVAWYREVNQVDQQVEDTAQLFLGLRIQCARCHHHPFEKWSQRDYYGFAAFFSQVGKKPGLEPDEDRIYHKRGLATATNPKTGEKLRPTGLDAAPLDVPADRDPRQALVDWMAAEDNRFFAPALVNRYWKHLFNRGIVDPEDDLRVTNPASNPELLDALARHFIASGFDLKDLVRTICRSSVYQLSSDPNEHNLNDKQNFSRYYPKRLGAEVLLDALDTVTGSPSSFSGLPAGTRAVQIKDTGVNSYFLTVFGRPEAASACECERSAEASLAQSLHLLNSTEVQGKLSGGNGRAAQLSRDSRAGVADKIRSVYLTVFSRLPADDELKVAVAHVEKADEKQKQQAYEDILWALVNTKEFLFNH